jgi:hypothetical protein
MAQKSLRHRHFRLSGDSPAGEPIPTIKGADEMSKPVSELVPREGVHGGNQTVFEHSLARDAASAAGVPINGL